MKVFKWVLSICVVGIAALCIGLGFTVREISQLETVIQQQQTARSAEEKRLATQTTTIVLTSRPYWYTVKEGEVSSEPNSNGLRVVFNGSDFQLFHPKTQQQIVDQKCENQKVKFSFVPAPNGEDVILELSQVQ